MKDIFFLSQLNLIIIEKKKGASTTKMKLISFFTIQSIKDHYIFFKKLTKNQLTTIYIVQQLAYFYNNFCLVNMNSFQQPILLCYDCSTTQNLRTCSEYTAICQKCYNRQVAEINYFKKYKQLEPEIDEITPQIYIGNQDAAISEDLLLERDITAICVCGNHLETPFINNPKYSYKRYEIGDASKQIILHLFEDHYQWINTMLRQGRKILVHCSAGVSRSASFVIAYFMREKGLSYQESLQFVRSKRVYVCPNSGFVAQLQAYQKQVTEFRKIEQNDRKY